MLDSVSRAQHYSVESAVLPSEVEQLPDLTGYLKYAGDPTWARVRLDATTAWQDAKPEALRSRDARPQIVMDASHE
jgi:hypothetical protein